MIQSVKCFGYNQKHKSIVVSFTMKFNKTD